MAARASSRGSGPSPSKNLEMAIYRTEISQTRTLGQKLGKIDQPADSIATGVAGGLLPKVPGW